MGKGAEVTAEELSLEFEGKRNFWDVLADEKYFKWILTIPLIVVLLVFMLYPLFYCVYYSVQQYDMVRPAHFIGLDNFRAVLQSGEFWHGLERTAYILVLSICIELLLGLGIALLFNREFRGQNIIRGLCLLPLLISPLIMSMMWNFILQYDFGVVNMVLNAIGFSKFNFFSPKLAIYTITFISVWQWTPFSIFVLLSGLRGLPKDAFEAARVDGAPAWLTFRRLTLPMLSPLIVIIIMLRTMWLIRLFDPLYATTRGGMGTETLDWMVYRISFVFFNMGLGSALAIISLFLTLIVCALMFRVLMKTLGVNQ